MYEKIIYVYISIAAAIAVIGTIIGVKGGLILGCLTIFLVMMFVTECYVAYKIGTDRLLITVMLVVMLMMIDYYLWYLLGPDSNVYLNILLIISCYTVGMIVLIKRKAILFWIRSRPRLQSAGQ
ncbi:MAG: hypothetical protein WC998_03560 [Candidatus Paceibacterota bacterium]